VYPSAAALSDQVATRVLLQVEPQVTSIAMRVADKVAARVADSVADRVADAIATRLADKLAAKLAR
jgi:hypothetical protein